MNPLTLEAIEKILCLDDSITEEQRTATIKAMRERLSGRPPRMGTAEEAAEILGKCKTTVQRYATKGLLTPIRITARHVLYDLNEVEDLVNSGSRKRLTETD